MTTVAPPYRFHKSFAKMFSKSRVVASLGWRGKGARGAKAPSRLGRALVIVPALALLCGDFAQAQWPLSTAAGVGGTISAGGQTLNFQDSTGNTGISTAGTACELSVLQQAPPAYEFASAYGRATVTFPELMDLRAHFSGYASASSRTGAGGIVNAGGSGYDTLYLSSSDPSLVGNTLRLTFAVFFDVSAPAVTSSQAKIYARAQAGGLDESVTAIADIDGFSTSGIWDGFESPGLRFSVGLFHLDLPIGNGQRGLDGSVSFPLYTQSTTQAQGNIGSYDAEEFVDLAFITLPDVNNVTPASKGVSVLFLSGKNVPEAVPTVSPYSSSGTGGWNNPNNWMNGVPNGDGATATFGAISEPQQVTGVFLTDPTTLGTLYLGSGTPGAGYAISGAGSNTLTFSYTAAAFPSFISVSDGAHAIDAPVVLASDLIVTSTSSTPWTLTFGTASSITDNGGGMSLTLSASNGTLILSGSNNYSGGTFVSDGTLVVTNPAALPDGGNITVGDSSFFDIAANSFAPVAAAATAVPEPGSLALAAMAVAIVSYRWRSFPIGRGDASFPRRRGAEHPGKPRIGG